ncbi:hypothetical protein [Actinokineospora sp. HUAS TT18]|uniref:hypothetical protein n=1 Tax=Actinokineospora sp. HUAS TT18 TaxID=3447451 RepID=UPI003F51AFFF
MTTKAKVVNTVCIALTVLILIVVGLVVSGAWEWLFSPASRVDGLGTMMSPAICA